VGILSEQQDPEELRYYREQASPFSWIYNAARERDAKLSRSGRRPIFGGLGSKEIGNYGFSTGEWEVDNNLGGVLAGLLSPVLKAFDAPYSAYQGLIPEQDLVPEVMGIAGLAMGGGAASNLRKGSELDPATPTSNFGEDWSDVYHWSKSDDYFDDFDFNKMKTGTSNLGPHVGTAAAAEARSLGFEGPIGEFGGSMYTLKGDLRKPFNNPKTGRIWEEADLEEFLSNVANENNLDRSLEAPQFMRQRLAAEGYTDIPYINGVEDVDSISNIMLIDRPNKSDAVLRNDDARFDNSNRNLRNLSFANKSASGGLLSAAVANELKSGSKANKADLDPLGYQKTRMKDVYLSDTDVRYTDSNENLPRNPMSWEDIENKVVLPFYGDRTSRGLLVDGVNDVNFDNPVYTEGGVDFMVGPAAQADNSIWASNQNIITRIDKEAEKAVNNFQGEDILGLTGSMAPDANDFATMTGAAMAELVKNAKITKKSAKEFDEVMRAIDPDFVGILSPNIREWAETTTSPKRKSFIRLMDSAPMQANGFPSPAEARYSVTDPTQRGMRAGMFGLGAAKIDTSSPLIFNNPKGNLPKTSVPHSTYNTQIAGEYLGSLPPIPQGLLFKDVYDAMAGKLTKNGRLLNEAHKTHAIKTKMPAQKVTPEILEGILDYLSRMEK
tara:strand:+ start:131 stop:2128 length:1998 start_codon:yes stop_codon:yes gene_type:complete